jgi:hypothetical protein
MTGLHIFLSAKIKKGTRLNRVPFLCERINENINAFRSG